MKKSEKIHDIIFAILSIASSLAFLFCLLFNYKFIAMQCIFLFICLYLPMVIQFIFKIKITTLMYYIYEAFLLSHFVLGEIFSFYINFLYFDTILHYLSAICISLLGYSIIHYYLDENVLFIQVLFAILFGITSEFVWEILEFTIDHFLNTNMQRFIKDGMILSGHDALKDTIKDMVVAISGCSNIIFLVKIRPFKNMKIKRAI